METDSVIRIADISLSLSQSFRNPRAHGNGLICVSGHAHLAAVIGSGASHGGVKRPPSRPPNGVRLRDAA